MAQSCVHPDAGLLCAVEPGPVVAMRDLKSAALRWNAPAPASTAGWPRISPDARLVAFALQDWKVRLLHAADGSLAADLAGHTGEVQRVRFSTDSARMITASSDGTARVWDIAAAREVARFQTPGQATYAAELCPVGTLAASGGDDRRVHLWDSATGVEVKTLAGFNSVVWSLAFSPDGRRLAVGSQDRIVRIFDTSTGDELLQLRHHTGTVMRIAWSPDGRFLATGGYDQYVCVCDSARPALQARPEQP